MVQVIDMQSCWAAPSMGCCSDKQGWGPDLPVLSLPQSFPLEPPAAVFLTSLKPCALPTREILILSKPVLR